MLPNTTGTKVSTWTGSEGTGPVPGKGCLMFLDANGNNDDWGSWSNAPDDLVTNRACLYNLKLSDDPWNATPYLNHTLHEFGHALGLSHEQFKVYTDKIISELENVYEGKQVGCDGLKTLSRKAFESTPGP